MEQLGSMLWLDSCGSPTPFGPVGCNLCLPTCFELQKGLPGQGAPLPTAGDTNGFVPSGWQEQAQCASRLPHPPPVSLLLWGHLLPEGTAKPPRALYLTAARDERCSPAGQSLGELSERVMAAALVCGGPAPGDLPQPCMKGFGFPQCQTCWRKPSTALALLPCLKSSPRLSSRLEEIKQVFQPW